MPSIKIKTIKNKKGLSDVVATVIFISLIIASISLFVPSVIKLAKSPGEQLSPFASCIEMQTSPSTIENARYNEQTGTLEVTVQRSPINELQSFTFILQKDTGSSSFTCGPTCGGACNMQNPGQEKTFYFSEENVNRVTLYVNDNCEIDAIEI